MNTPLPPPLPSDKDRPDPESPPPVPRPPTGENNLLDRIPRSAEGERIDPRRTADEGSLAEGCGLGLAAAAGGFTLAIALLRFAFVSNPSIGYFAFVPILAMIGLFLWSIGTGKTKSALGVVLALALIVAPAFLLVSACFGMLKMGN